jgi:catechol 2,3-dioxygenase-like lactoylglutathione lyase family enzyme
MLPVRDVKASTAFIVDVLGFDCVFAVEGHAYLRRDGATLRLISAPPDADLEDTAWQSAVYIDVEGVDDLYVSLEPQLVSLPPEHLRAPFDRPYGQREFHVIHDVLLFQFGQPTTSGGPQ